MADSRTIRLDPGCAPDALWPSLAGHVAEACAAWRLSLRDAVVAVPFAQLIDPARQAFARLGGWQPRIETTDTWGASLGPGPAPQAGLLSGLATLDALTAAQLLRRQAGLAEWEARDPRAFAEIVAATIATAQALHGAAHARAPADRAAFWDEVLLDSPALPPGVPGGLERSLARAAAEWARLSPPPATDRLFGTRPGALFWLDAGGADPLLVSLAAALPVPSVRFDADPDVERPFDAVAMGELPRVVVVDGLEAEARAVAAEVIDRLGQGHRPVALIALDRALMRRVRALLERRGIGLADETGWALSTTRAAAAVMTLLKAASRRARHDEWLDALKCWPIARVHPAALQQLEQLWRAGKPVEGSAAGGLLAWASEAVARLDGPGRRGLDDWLETLGMALAETGLSEALSADVAGRQVLTGLHLQEGPVPAGALAEAMRHESLDAAGFRAWVDRTLERAHFTLPTPVAADVVLTPLARAMLRPFGAAVIGGADERHLLAASRHEGLLSEPAARALGLPTPMGELARERLALAQLLRQARVTFVRRRLEGAEPLAASPALEALAMARRRLGLAAWEEGSVHESSHQVEVAPVVRPSPSAAQALPERLSASTLEALRACPYKFFARSVLRLREIDELDEAVDKRDYGNWLHAVLDRFHHARASGDVGDDGDALRQAADEVSAEQAIPRARLLPYRIGFEWLVPAYLRWLNERERAGQHWQAGEFDAERTLPELGGIILKGRIDRQDRGPAGVCVIDYKTGSVPKLKSQLRNPCEDTQLAFYALLMQADLGDEAAFQAMYLALDTKDAPEELAHPGVVKTARTLLAGLADDLRRLRAGAGLPAHGEGRTCEICEARGLCRRDHWTTTP
jgi:ATP-dependent helicase/nuclease subunit B